MRTQGILLVRNAIVLSNNLPIDGEHCVHILSWFPAEKPNFTNPGTKLRSWRQSCDQVLASLEEFSQKLLDKGKRFREHGGKVGADIICSSCITCVAHLAALCEVVCRTDPDAREMYNLCDSVLQRLGMLTSEFHPEEYMHFDLLLGVRHSPCHFPTVTAQTWDLDRILGRNRYRPLTSA